MNAGVLAVAILAAAGMMGAAGQSFIRADLKPAAARKAAPDFALQDAAGKTVKLGDFRGKVVLLDFWATWCTGCKQEIPWFTEFQAKYGPQGFVMVGVSLDEDGWKVLRPFLASHKIPYAMLLGDHATAGRYGIHAMPDTFLIDPEGRIAASYIAGLVNRENVEANIRAILPAR